ncbi:MAG: DUF2510 domain-containing protein [Schumannella sp.]|nr:DUF2510 domain-containing protein [Microbacteriaceae bacterium]
MEQTTRVVPAGWYEDPADGGRVRWWNGLSWTEHVEAKPAGAAAGAAADQRAAEARDLERQHGLTAGETDVMTRRASMMLDARGPSTGTIPVQGIAVPTHAIRTGTTSAWLLAVTPVLASLLAAVAAYIYFYVSPTPLVAAIALVLMALGFLWAVGDSKLLRHRGFTPPSPLLALALPLVGPLLYLIVRSRKVSGAGPLLGFLVLLVVAVLAPVALGIAGGAQTITKALEVQRAVSDDLVGSGAATSVTCPPIVESTSTGSVYTCDAVLPSGETAHVWVSFDNEQGAFSWALANR